MKVRLRRDGRSLYDPASMPNGKPGDNPITDMLHHGAHPFPPDIEEMIRKLAAVAPHVLNDLGWDPFAWEAGKNLDDGRERKV